MIKSYVINLERDSVRRSEMQMKFPKKFTEASIINAVDAKNESSLKLLSDYNTSCTHNARSQLSLSEKCCAISHLIALTDFVKSDAEWCIIFEDDILGTDQDIQAATEIISNIHHGGLLILGGQDGMKNSKYLSGTRTHLPNVWFIPSIARRFIYRTCCYAADKSTAKGIIAKQSKCLHRADDWKWLTRDGENLFYTKILKHPTDLTMSNIEASRTQISDNLIDFTFRSFSKMTIVILRFLSRISKI